MVEVDPIRCWWRTSDGAVGVGQPFSIVLTCAVVETSAVRVVADEAPLAIGTVQLAPFELLGGNHPADLRRGDRRFFQYEYSVRIIDPTVIGRDAKLPDMVIHYRVESRVQSQPLEGRDRTYLLPPQAVRIVSMVPADAADIRDASGEQFGAIQAMRFRARVLNIVALALAALGVIVVLPAVARALVGARGRPATERKALADRTVLNGVAAELTAVQHESRGGWTPALLARALTALRIAAAYALGRRVRQRALTEKNHSTDARLVVKSRWWDVPRLSRPLGSGSESRGFAVSSPVTAADVARELERLPLTTSHERRQLLEALQQSLATLSRTLYSHDSLDDAGNDAAIAAAISVVQQLRRAHAWPRLRTNRLPVARVATAAEPQRRI